MKSQIVMIDNNDVVLVNNAGVFFLVSLVDLPVVQKNAWSVDHYGYLIGRAGNKVQKLHRVLLGLTKNDPVVVDHKNGNPLDNRRENLRICQQIDNVHNANRRTDNTSGYTGIDILENGKYRVRIMVAGERLTIGRFANFADAVAARRAAEEKFFGEFAPQYGVFSGK